MTINLPKLLGIIALSFVSLGLSFMFAWWAIPEMTAATVVHNGPGSLWMLWIIDTLMLLGLGIVFGFVLERE